MATSSGDIKKHTKLIYKDCISAISPYISLIIIISA